MSNYILLKLLIEFGGFIFFAFFTGIIIERRRDKWASLNNLSFLFLTIKGMALERDFQKALINRIKRMFKGCYVLKNDGSNTPQGFPDLLIIHNNKWAALECKKESKSHRQANQDYYVSTLNNMSFAKVISPENEEEVLNDLQQAFRD